MDRASLAHRIWFETKVPVYVERFILPILAVIVIVLVMQNSFNLTWDQRVALFLVVAASAYLIATAIHRTKQPLEERPPVSSHLDSPRETQSPPSPDLTPPVAQENKVDNPKGDDGFAHESL